MYTKKKITIRCPSRETNKNNSYCVKLCKSTKVNAEALYMLCPCSFIVLNVSPGPIFGGLYSEGYVG